MNSKTLLLLVPLLVRTALAAPIDINSGGLTYTQNFDTLPVDTNNSTAVTPWTDDSTLPGWSLYRGGVAATPLGYAGAGFNYYVGDGSIAANTQGHGFYSMGTGADPDRAFGFSSTTSQGEQSMIVTFHNATANNVRLTNVKFNVEVYHENTTANTNDSIFMWYRVAPDAAAATAVTTAATNTTVFPPAVSGGVTPGLYISDWTQADQYRHTQKSANVGQTLPPLVVPFNAAPAAPIVIPAGQYLNIRWSNVNDAGADATQGIDDLELTFVELNAAVFPVATNVTREPGAILTDPSDDTVSFDLTVTGSGSISPSGWVTPASSPVAPNSSGAYGPTVHFTRPISEFGASGVGNVVVQDAGDANAGSVATVTAPKFIPRVTTAFSPGITFTPAAAGASAFTAPANAISDIGWSNTTATSLVEVQPTPNTSGNKYFKHTSAVATMTTEPVSLSEIGGKAVELEVGMGAYTTSGSGLEDADTIAVNLEVALDGDFNNLAAGNVITVMVAGIDGINPPLGAAWGASIAVANPYINLGTVGYPTGDFLFTKFKNSIAVPAANAATAMARMVYASTNGITTEHVLVDDVVFRAVTSDTLSVSTPTNITRNANGPGVADDTVNFTVDIGGLGISPTWNATGATPASGAYGNGIVLNVPAGVGVYQASVTITDSVNPALTKTFNLRFEPIYLIGTQDLGAGAQDLYSAPVTTTGQEWKNTPATRVTTMNSTLASATVKTFHSETLNLTGLNNVVVTFTVGVEDRSSGFEAPDELRLYAILNGDTLNPENLVASNEAGAYDDGSPLFPVNTTAGDGILSGGELVPAGTYTAAPYFTRDYAFRYLVPAGTTSLQLEFSSTNDSASEFVHLKDLLVAVSNFSDADGDGMSDSYEDANGLNKSDPNDKLTDLDGDGQNNYAEYLAGTGANDTASTLRVIAAGLSPAGEVSLTWTSVPGKKYRVRVSTDLGVTNVWANLGGTVTATGATTSIPAGNIVPPGTFPRYFIRVEVVP